MEDARLSGTPAAAEKQAGSVKMARGNRKSAYTAYLASLELSFCAVSSMCRALVNFPW